MLNVEKSMPIRDAALQAFGIQGTVNSYKLSREADFPVPVSAFIAAIGGTSFGLVLPGLTNEFAQGFWSNRENKGNPNPVGPMLVGAIADVGTLGLSVYEGATHINSDPTGLGGWGVFGLTRLASNFLINVGFNYLHNIQNSRFAKANPNYERRPEYIPH